MSERSATDVWANFLMNEKLDPQYLNEEDIMLLIELAQAAGAVRRPKISMHKDKLESRAFLCETAMDLGIDLPSIKRKGRVAMGRGLLDAWNKVYVRKYGSAVGTLSAWEAKRRDVKTRLCKQGIKGVRRGPSQLDSSLPEQLNDSGSTGRTEDGNRSGEGGVCWQAETG